MLRTCVSARGRGPERSVRWRHAGAIPEGVAYTTMPFVTRHFLVLAEHRKTRRREERGRSSRGSTQIKAYNWVLFFSMTPRVPMQEEGKDALHGHVECVERFGDRLATPIWLRHGS